MIGLRVGPFEIAERAEVPEPGDWYYARRSEMSQKKPHEVLVRVLPPDADAEARIQLQRQFENLRQVEHARVPIAVAMYEGVGAMAITAVRGAPLAQVVEARAADGVAMSPATLLDLLLEVAEILQYAHHRGRAHGHLEPRHLLLAGDGNLWVLGFAAGATAEVDPAWCPPERARGEPATEATDQWSLGALGTALITGRPPWPGEDALATARLGDPEPLVEPIERQWPALARLLRKMLDPRPANRHAGIHKVRQELLALSRKAGGASARRDLAQLLNRGADPGPSTGPQLGDTLTPPDAIGPSSEDTLPPQPVPPSAPPAPSPAPEEPSPTTVRGSTLSMPPPSGPKAQNKRSDASDADIPVARSLPGSATRPRATGALPSEELPVVRPDLAGDVPAAGRDAQPTPGTTGRRASRLAPVPAPDAVLEDNTGPTMLADLQALAAAQGMDLAGLGLATDADDGGEVNVAPHPSHDPKSVADPPSLPLDLGPPGHPDHEDSAGDYEATLLFTAAGLDDASGGAFNLAEPGGEVVVQVEYTEDEPVPAPLGKQPGTPTLSPTTDADPHSEEVPAPSPHAVAGGDRPASRSQPPSAHPQAGGGFLPDRVPDSVGHEPELGSLHGGTSSQRGPSMLGEDDLMPPVELPPRANPLPQRIALGSVAVLGLLFLVWAVSRMM